MMLDIHFGLLVIILSQLTSSSVMQRKRNQEAQCSFKDSEPNYLVPRNRWINLRWKKKNKQNTQTLCEGFRPAGSSASGQGASLWWNV